MFGGIKKMKLVVACKACLLCLILSLYASVSFADLPIENATEKAAEQAPGGVNAIQHSDVKLAEFYVLYQSVLSDYLVPGEKNGVELNLVNYADLRSDDRLDTLMQFLAEYDYDQLTNKTERIAYFLNAYNIMAINMVVENWPLKSLRGLGNMFRPVWTHSCGTFNNEHMTLRKLEHDILRKQNEPRIHFALNCASVSCPDLRSEPYVGERLEQQLSEQTFGFFKQSVKGVVVDGNQIKVTPLLDWFEEDFEPVGGVTAFLHTYLPKDSVPADWQLQGFLPYDWEVNAHLSGSEKRQIRMRDK